MDVEDLEKQWLVSLQRSDREAFADIYDFYWKKLLSIAFTLTKNKETAEEIVQEVFVSLWNRREDVQISSLSHYLATAVKFSSFKSLQRARRREEILSSEILQVPYQQDQNTIDARFLQEYLHGVVDSLPERCRLVFQLSRDEHYSNREIATELQISEKAVEANITRALKVLRVQLRKVGFIFLFFL
ncbi:RNA polymerase sigma-70 factor [Sphingobacterium sp.]|uniref:RNA polymerase sigma-70 factor n=1 Tax=Sphingobacterium sp. TaxID=341027 RepID=UPI0028A06C02|nr:RNA polymerase sigma-70 factor [Sphingobacterium sp.]